MFDRIFSEPEHEKSMLRQLKIIIVVLVLSNIALGGFGFYFLRAIDRKYSDLIESGRTADASKQREESLRPAFERYLETTTKAADVLEAESLKTSDLFTERTVSMSRIMLGLASWPVMILGIFLLITAVFIIAVL